MEKSEIKDVQTFSMSKLGKTRNCATVRRVVNFINRQPGDAIIVFYDTCDFYYSSRRNRKPLYDAEIYGAWGPGRDHGKFFWVLAYKPETK